MKLKSHYTIDQYMTKSPNAHQIQSSKVEGQKTKEQLLVLISKFLHKNTIIKNEIFIDLDISKFPKKVSPGAPLDEWANYVIENTDEFQIRSRKRKIDDDLEPIFISLEPKKTKSDENPFQMFIEEFSDYFQKLCKVNSKSKPLLNDVETVTKLLLQHFPLCRGLLISHLVEELNASFSLAALVCFFVESRASNYVCRYFGHIESQDWNVMVSLMPQARKPRKNWIEVPLSGPVADSFRDFRSLIDMYRDKYPEIFKKDEDRLIENITDIGKEKLEECHICCEQFPHRSRVQCSFVCDVATFHVNKNVSSQHLQSGLKTDESVTENGLMASSSHNFCASCFVGQAQAATTEMTLAKGGIGLPCMETGCNNVLLFSEYRGLIPPKIRHLLNARILEENLGMAGLENLERCMKCNFAIVIESPADKHRIFSCFRCDYQYCRICQRPWRGEHFGKTCDEFDAEKRMEEKLHTIENALCEIVIRKCHRCNLAFVKDDGCNKMVCRCGANQCYLCRTMDIDYDHFCRHVRKPGQIKCSFKTCKKLCLLWTNPNILDDAKLDQIKEQAHIEGLQL